jgi:hypothetical protein
MTETTDIKGDIPEAAALCDGVGESRRALDFVERTRCWYEQMIALPRSTIVTLMKPGGGIARLIDRGGKKSRDFS